MADKVKVQELDPSDQELIMSHYKDPFKKKLARFGDNGFTLPISYKEEADEIINMAVRADDLWVSTFPRSGTTWIQELIWLLMNDFDYVTAAKISLKRRYYYLEIKHITHVHNYNMYNSTHGQQNAVLLDVLSNIPTLGTIVNAPSPRYIKTHLPFSLLPPNLLDTTKVVYVARNPRDVAVSYYHFNKLLSDYQGDFKSYWNFFINDLVTYSPFFPHLKEAWALRNHPNMLFIFYEELNKDLHSCIKRIADFLGKKVTYEQVMKLSEHLDIKQFKKNESVNQAWMQKLHPHAEGFIRKGGSGGWREHLDEEMAAQAERWLRDNLAGTDLRFPSAS